MIITDTCRRERPSLPHRHSAAPSSGTEAGYAEYLVRSPMLWETLAELRSEQLQDVLGIRLNGPKIQGKRIALIWSFADMEGTSFST